MKTQVHIEFQRIQTWLFSVPRLRAMVGGNTLLDEMLRLTLPVLARQHSDCWQLCPLQNTSQYPTANQNDPLHNHDDPQADAKDGIISHDGGHFEAQFAGGAEAFAEVARKLI
ncbi:MAG: hypothetical protein ACUVR8_12885 [Acidobacteriota bacterium]